MTFSGTTMAFMGIMPLFTGTTPAFGTNCCCAGLTSGLVYIEVGSGIKWFKPYSAIPKFDASGNVFVGKTGVNSAEVLKFNSAGIAQWSHNIGPGGVSSMDIDGADSAYVIISGGSYKITSGTQAWTGAGGNYIHYSASRNKVIVTGGNVLVLNVATGTTEQDFSPVNGGSFSLGSVTDANGDTYVATQDLNSDLVIHKYAGTNETTTWVSGTNMTTPLHYDAAADKLYVVSAAGQLHEIYKSTGGTTLVSHVNTWQTTQYIDTDSSSRFYLNGCSFGGTNYAAIRYSGTAADWGYDPSAFFNIDGQFHAADATGTAMAMVVFFDQGNLSAPLF